jgi:bifunctional non-homologous end joining protein LigD
MVLPCRRLSDDGRKAWAIVEERGYEGMVAKDPHSRYRGGATSAWVKVKQRREGVFPIGGIATTSDGFVGALVGQRHGRMLHYLGTMEMGYNRASVALLLDRSASLVRPTSPFADLPSLHGVT